jgi:hypothetical protein
MLARGLILYFIVNFKNEGHNFEPRLSGSLTPWGERSLEKPKN